MQHLLEFATLVLGLQSQDCKLKVANFLSGAVRDYSFAIFSENHITVERDFQLDGIQGGTVVQVLNQVSLLYQPRRLIDKT
jgi:hypothetical protein